MEERIVICDIDGTAANIDHRVHHVQDKRFPVDWDTFFDEMVHDTPNKWCQTLVESLLKNNTKIVSVTGRPDNYREQTRKWLSIYYPGVSLVDGGLFMRKSGDRRKDSDVKSDIYDEHLIAKNILFVIDDRNQVVDMWRQRGLTVLQCDYGNF